MSGKRHSKLHPGADQFRHRRSLFKRSCNASATWSIRHLAQRFWKRNLKVSSLAAWTPIPNPFSVQDYRSYNFNLSVASRSNWTPFKWAFQYNGGSLLRILFEGTWFVDDSLVLIEWIRSSSGSRLVPWTPWCNERISRTLASEYCEPCDPSNGYNLSLEEMIKQKNQSIGIQALCIPSMITGEIY